MISDLDVAVLPLTRLLTHPRLRDEPNRRSSSGEAPRAESRQGAGSHSAKTRLDGGGRSRLIRQATQRLPLCKTSDYPGLERQPTLQSNRTLTARNGHSTRTRGLCPRVRVTTRPDYLSLLAYSRGDNDYSAEMNSSPIGPSISSLPVMEPLVPAPLVNEPEPG